MVLKRPIFNNSHILTKTFHRLRLKVEQTNFPPWASAKLVLEGAVLEGGWVYPSLALPVRNMMEKSASTAIPLWETPISWHSPMPAFGMITSPGLEMSADSVACSDTFLRWCMTHVLNECRKGREVTTAEEWTKYMAEPKGSYPTSAPRYEFVIPFSTDPGFCNIDTGKPVVYQVQASSPHDSKVKHKMDNNEVGRENNEYIEVVRSNRKIKVKKPSKKKVAEATARPKYCPIPRPHFQLSRAAFPAGTPDHMIEQARAVFASSVSSSSQASYTSAYNHLLKAEAKLGRSFSSPPLESEISYFTTYLIEKKISKPSIQSYLSGLRFVVLSRGAQSHTPMPALATQLMSGVANMNKNAMLEALKCRRRPITLNILILLRSSIAAHPSWTPYEKSLRWSTMMLAYWGSFRMGELLSQEKQKFNPSTSLLPSDLQFKEDCLAVWIRSPKIWTQGGDIVEVWRVLENEDMDPVLAVSRFLQFRNETFGDLNDKPVFIHQDGSLYTKSELNKDLKDLLAQFPALSGSGRESWSGHSFRAGLATLLTSLGFSEEQVKKWGRWHSAAYMLYAQDLTMRRKTRAELTSVFGKMLSSLN